MGYDCAFDLQVFLLPDKAAYLTVSPAKNLIGRRRAKLRIRHIFVTGSATHGG